MRLRSMRIVDSGHRLLYILSYDTLGSDLSFRAIFSGLRCVYRCNIARDWCPDINATSGTDKPISKNREIASCLQSCRRKSIRAARRVTSSHPCLTDAADTGNNVERVTRGLIISTAFCVRGTRLGRPFFVNGRYAIPSTRFTFFASNDKISPRRMPVSRAIITIGFIYHRLELSSATIKRLYSVSFRRRSRALSARGSLIRCAGFMVIGSDHSRIAISIQCRIIANSLLTVAGFTIRKRSSR